MIAALAFAVPLVAATASPAPPNAAPGPPLSIAFAALTLADAQRVALDRSPDVAAARARESEAAAALAQARGVGFPSLTAGYVEAPQGGSNAQTIAQRLTSVGLQANIADILASSPSAAGALAAQRAASADRAAAELAERIKTVGLYYDALKANAIDAARASAVVLAKRQRDAAALRERAGDVPRLDVIRADVAVARATADAETAHAASENALEALRTETAAAPGALAVVPAPPPAPVTLPASSPDEAADVALRARPEVRSASEATVAARAAERAARSALFPAVTVAGGYSSGVDSGVAVHGPTLSVNATLPLSGTPSAKVAQQTAVVRESEAKEASLRRQIGLDAAAAYRNDVAARRATAAADEALRESGDELSATELGYRNGASSSLDLTSARETYTQALVDDLSARYDEAKAAATLALELGR